MKKPIQSEHDALVSALLGDKTKGSSLTPEDMINNLQAEGYRIVKDNPESERRHRAKIVSFSKARWEGGTIVKFGAFSCPHFGSRQQQLTLLESFYDRCVAEGVTDIFCAGDIAEGDGTVYKGQRFDVFVHGADRQAAYIIEKFPKRKGVRTHAIAGNHDMSFWQHGGVDILERVASQRSDILYYGPYGARLNYGGVDIYISHGDGNSSYARSHKQQRRIEQFAPEQKPEVYFLGHYHTWDYLPMYRNVVSWQLGCFQSQTDFLKRKGVYPEIGGLLLTIYKGTKGADRPGGFVRVICEVVPYYVPNSDDF
jgi:predicted phosphodiesterase